jgi:hypothetical protein
MSQLADRTATMFQARGVPTFEAECSKVVDEQHPRLLIQQQLRRARTQDKFERDIDRWEAV